MNTKPELCHCGKPLHYADPVQETIMRKMVETFGNNVVVSAQGRSWLVPRHYIALHGIYEPDLPRLGFTEIPPMSGQRTPPQSPR